MADQNREFDVNEDIDLNKEYDLIEKIDSLERENHLLKMKVEELEATHRVELEAKERGIEHQKKMLEELDSHWKSKKDLQSMTKDELAENGVNELLRKIDMLEATRRIELEAKEREIKHRKKILEELDSHSKSQKDLQSMTKGKLAESGVNELLRKIDMLEATHRLELEAKEGEISGLKRQLEEQESRWKSKKDFTEWRRMSWRKGMDIKGLRTKISELENKLEIQDKVISQMRIKENEQAGGSSGVNIDQ